MLFFACALSSFPHRVEKLSAQKVIKIEEDSAVKIMGPSNPSMSELRRVARRVSAYASVMISGVYREFLGPDLLLVVLVMLAGHKGSRTYNLIII